MTPIKKEALEFCMDKYVTNKFVDIWLTIILTLGLAIIIFPILLWLVYKYIKAKKKIKILKSELNNSPETFSKVKAVIGFGNTRIGVKVANSVELDIDGELFDIPQLYIWFSKYKTKESLLEILND